MKKGWLVLGLVVGLVGCTRSSIIEYNISLGRHSFTPSVSPDYDYDVKVTQEVDIGWDTANPDDRMRVIKQLLGDNCKSPVIIEESFIDRGEYAIGTKKGVYFIKVSCP